VSPFLYFYPKEKTNLSVTPIFEIIYGDPEIPEKSWKFLAYPEGRLEINGETKIIRSRLYYEYNPAKFSLTEPKEGFVIVGENWKEFIKYLAFRLGLKENEIFDLTADFGNTLKGLRPSRYLKISLADQKEIERNLPLKINPKPESFTRIHFLVSSLDDFVVLPEPEIKPIIRNGFTALEIGVIPKP